MNISETLLTPVTQEEFAKGSRVLSECRQKVEPAPLKPPVADNAKFLEYQPSHSRHAEERRPRQEEEERRSKREERRPRRDEEEVKRRSKNKKCKSRHRRGASSDEDSRPRSRKH